MKQIFVPAAMCMLLTYLTLVSQTSLAASVDLPIDKGTSITQTYTVGNMTCAACPITVRKAMSRVNGVERVDVNFSSKTVTVTFDPALADTAMIAEASTSVGFPAQVVEKEI